MVEQTRTLNLGFQHPIKQTKGKKLQGLTTLLTNVVSKLGEVQDMEVKLSEMLLMKT